MQSKESDAYSCAITTKYDYFTGWKTIGHIRREISNKKKVGFMKH